MHPNSRPSSRPVETHSAARRSASRPFVAEDGQVVHLRSAAQGEWCWQSKRARRLIRRSFDATHNVQSALAVYDALCEIASDAASESFVTTHLWIQQLSDVSVSTIKKHLDGFVALGLLHISRAKFRTPSTYLLLEVEDESGLPAPTGCTVANEPLTSGPAASEERLKNLEDQSPAPAVAGESALKLKTTEPKPEPDQHDHLLAALAALDGSEPGQTTVSAWNAASKALREIRAVCPGLTVTEIQRRATHYRAHLPCAALSALSLTKHWGRCNHPPAPRPQPQSSARIEAPVRRLNLSSPPGGQLGDRSR